jgi:hypothetical protein
MPTHVLKFLASWSFLSLHLLFQSQELAHLLNVFVMRLYCKSVVMLQNHATFQKL